MNKDKVAIFVDWQNLYADLSKTRKRLEPSLTFDYNNIPHLTYFFHSFLTKHERLFRIFFYTAMPMSSGELSKFINDTKRYQNSPELNAFQTYWNTPLHLNDASSTPLAKQEKNYTKAKEFQENLMKSNLYALRLGQQRCQNLEANGRPNLAQKQVDMLIGIDVSHVSFFKLVDTVIIFSKDTDMIPALKVARVSGLQTIIASVGESGHPDIRLQKHSDFRRTRTLLDIDKEGKMDKWNFLAIKKSIASFK